MNNQTNKVQFRYLLGLITYVLLIIQCTTNPLFRNGNNINIKNHFIDSSLSDRVTLINAVNSKIDTATFYLFSHGRAGELLIGEQWLSAVELVDFLRPKLIHKSTLNIYGCNFAKGEKGRAAVDYLETNLGIAVAASDDVTGVDGDWELEVGEKSIGHFNFSTYSYNLQNFDLDFELTSGSLPTLDRDINGDASNESIFVADVGGTGQSSILPPFGLWGGGLGGYLVTGLDASSGNNFFYYEGVDNCINLRYQHDLVANTTYEVCFDIAALDPDDAIGTALTNYFTFEIHNPNTGRYAIIGHPDNEGSINSVYNTGTNTFADYLAGSGNYFVSNSNMSVSTANNDETNIEWKQVCVNYTTISDDEFFWISSFGGDGGGIALDNITCTINTGLAIGNYVWCDSIFNGVQDAIEEGIDSLIVQLYTSSNVLIGQDTTIGGLYEFNEFNIDTTGITVDVEGLATPNTAWSGLSHNTNYQIVFGVGQYQNADGTFVVGSEEYGGFTPANYGGDDELDSDVEGATFLTFSGSKPRFYPEINITTPDTDSGDLSYDMGLLCGDITYSL